MRALIVDYGVGNLFSIASALRRFGLDVVVNREVSSNYDLIVFPGVGNFAFISKFIKLNASKLSEVRSSGTSFLGICIGMHVMLEYGLEGGLNRGLGWFKGFADRIRADVKLPHIGWDRVYVKTLNDLNEPLNGQYVYFMHSYIAYTTETCNTFGYYGVEFPALLQKGDIIGTQFHPEKSGKVGMKFLDTLIRWLRR